MRLPVSILAALGLAACTPTVPDSGAGVGFQDYGSYIRGAEPAPAPLPAPAPSGSFSPETAAAAIDRADGVAPAPLQSTALPAASAPAAPAPAEGTRPRGNQPAGIQEQTGEVIHSNIGISDEQDFSAVSQRETIESDKARIERNRSQYVVVQPGALPQRPGDTGPNIVEFALATTHPPGTQMYSRSALFRKDPNVVCARYASPDLAQQDFLATGGPDRDRKGLDPDGDGYACSWDPRPFRTVRQ